MNNSIVGVREHALKRQRLAGSGATTVIVSLLTWSFGFDYDVYTIFVALIVGAIGGALVLGAMWYARPRTITIVELELTLYKEHNRGERRIQQTVIVLAAEPTLDLTGAASWINRRATAAGITLDDDFTAATLEKLLLGDDPDLPVTNGLALDGGRVHLRLRELWKGDTRPVLTQTPSGLSQSDTLELGLVALAVRAHKGPFEASVVIDDAGDKFEPRARTFATYAELIDWSRTVPAALRVKYRTPAQRGVIDNLARRWRVAADPVDKTTEELKQLSLPSGPWVITATDGKLTVIVTITGV